jgi:signal transduction histidine kinase/DNA-binding response OmpR family regulator
MGGNRSIQFRHRVNNGLLALAFVLIIATSLVSVWSTNALSDSIEKVSHTYMVKNLVVQMSTALGGVEANGLRYMITGKSEYLMMHRQAIQEMDRVNVELAAVTQDNHAQQKNVSDFIQLYDKLVERSNASLKIKQKAIEAGDEQTPINRIRDGKGSSLVREMRDVLARMAAEEDRLMAQRADERDALVKQTNATVLIANGLALVAGVLGFAAIRRSQRESETILLVELKAAQARRASEEKSVFLANMSHEIRTPMNAIFGFAQLLSESVTAPVERDWVLSIKKGGQVLLGLINDVLDLSKIEAGKLQLNAQPTDLNEVIGETMELFSPLAAEKGIFLTREVDEVSLEPVVVDGQRVRQVLMNLISNAVKYTEQGGVVVRLSMSRSRDPGLRDVRILVSDSGVGIARDQLTHIFDPFHQSESPDGKVRQGTGLGLSITRRLVDLMRGRIHVDSELGNGSTFLIEIPELAVADALPLATVLSDERVDFNRLSPLTLLVVDDVTWNAEVAKGYLRNSHHTVHLASDGLEGVAAARALHPDVVLMDLRMPRMNGYEARDAIRTDPRLKGVAIVAVTASSVGGEERALRSTFDGYIQKPYTPADLFATLNALFGATDAAVAEPAAADTAQAEADLAAPDAGIEARWRRLRNDTLVELRRSMRMREIAAAAEELREIAADWPNRRLGDHAARLAAAVERFDVSAVKQLLDILATWPEDGSHA